MKTTVKNQTTPLMQQYKDIKKRHQDSIVFFRLGDFYEMFYHDAETAAPVLEVALTQRQGVPMCGVPYHAVNTYIAKLIKKGFKVAICEQLTDDAPSSSSKNLFRRDVMHVVTPGTLIEENLLDARNNNYCASLSVSTNSQTHGMFSIHCAFGDISTGDILVTSFDDIPGFPHLASQLAGRSPKEIIIPEHIKNRFPGIIHSITEQHAAVQVVSEQEFAEIQASDSIIPSAILTDEITADDELLTIVKLLISYIKQNRPSAVGALKKITALDLNRFMIIDETALKNLEIFTNLTDRSANATLLSVLDNTATSMGARMLRSWILNPLLTIAEIQNRQSAVQFFLDDHFFREELHQTMKTICDLERTINRLITGSANARDLIGIKNALQTCGQIAPMFREKDSNDLHSIPEQLSMIIKHLDPVPEMTDLIERSIVDAPPLSVKEGGIIKPGFNTTLDELRDAVTHGKDWIAELESKERERTGISNLKIGYTSVFGYYIEVTKSHLHKIPADYVRKQTLTNAERFITPELKTMEDRIVGSQTKADMLEYALFGSIKKDVLNHHIRIQQTAMNIAAVDALLSLALSANANNYTRPEIT
ncbi:MAG: DNA mismatch repair protein MutS, partial [Elusimicrobia bacterium]|nr:DNA mismatch repair protein MutS [Elusimicrobiota bacterium]